MSKEAASENRENMYVTRTLSNCRRNPSELSTAAPRGAPQSGSLVLRERGAERRGLFSSSESYKTLPLPSNMMLLSSNADSGRRFFFIPVLDQPLSSNRYYLIRADGRKKGLASRCADEELIGCCSLSNDHKPMPFDYRDEYQQFEIISNGNNAFRAKSVVPNNTPPGILRSKFHLKGDSESVHHLEDDARGLRVSIRSQLPELDSATSLVIGKWYTPFVFVKEGCLQDQMEKSFFYSVSLEKLWEKVNSWENDGSNNSKGNVIGLDVEIKRQVNFLFGVEAVKYNVIDNEGFNWFTSVNNGNGGGGGGGGGCVQVGLCSAVLRKMRWLEESVGWVDGVERVERVVEIGGFGRSGGGDGWRRVDCYVLVERFVLRRRDGTLVLNCDFRHTREIRIKWE